MSKVGSIVTEKLSELFLSVKTYHVIFADMQYVIKAH